MNEGFQLLSRSFLLICIANFLYFSSVYFIMPILPMWVVGLGGSPTQISIMISSYTLASVVVRPHLGKMADKYGHKPIMLGGVFCYGLIFLIYPLATTFGSLYLLRVLQGLAFAAFLVASVTYVAEAAPLERRGEAISIFSTSNVIAMALIPVLAIRLTQYTGDIFLLFKLSFFASAGVWFSVLAIGKAKPRTRQQTPTNLYTAFGKRPIIISSLALLAGMIVYGTILAFLPLYALERGLPDFGLFYSCYAGSTLISRVFTGRLSDRIGRRKVILPFMILFCLGILMFPILHNYSQLALIGICVGLGFGTYVPVLNALVVDQTPPQQRGGVLGLFTSCNELGIAVGAVFLGQVGETWGFATMFGLDGLIIIAGIFLFAWGSHRSYELGENI
jgi:MFS family permease